MKHSKRDIVIHYDEDSQKITYYSTDTSNTEGIRAKEFDGISPEVNFFKSLAPDVAEQKLGSLIFAILDLYSTQKIGIRDYEAIADKMQKEIDEGLDE